jgi:GT2 family glycosyltransferase
MKVAVNIVTFNSASDITACLESLREQTFKDFQIHILDNASSDDTLKFIEPFAIHYLARSPVNSGFCKAHNGLARRFPSEYILFLNPDTVLHPSFIEELVRALEARPDAASAGGKLIRKDGRTIDSAGIIMRREQRHLDRGAGELDTGQFDEPVDIFGPSAAAALYRRKALDDVSIDGQYFDEDFFAYREDADLAWRCRLFGWNSIYVPAAVAQHRRRVTPERRSQLPKEINYHSVKNRFLLRINNMTGDLYRRDFWQITNRDLAVIGYVFLREWSSIPAFFYIAPPAPTPPQARRDPTTSANRAVSVVQVEVATTSPLERTPRQCHIGIHEFAA